MPLVLAIEPDRRQAAQLTNIVRQRVGADLILAETTEGALESIGTRVPDLVLVPALLSPQDDAALATALRVIATAARVQMLTIPVLATQRKKKPARRGVLSSLLGGKEAPAPDGCDPAVFAEQISEYLARTAEERALDQRRPPIALTDDAHAVAPAYEQAAPPSGPNADLVREFEQPIAETPSVVINEFHPTIEHQSIVINQFAAPPEPATYSEPAAYVESTAYGDPVTHAEPAAYAEQIAYAEPAVYAEQTPTAYPDTLQAEPAAYAEPTVYAEPAAYAEPTYTPPITQPSSSFDTWAPQPDDSEPSGVDAATALPIASPFDTTPASSTVPTPFEQTDVDSSAVDSASLDMEPASDVTYAVPESRFDFARAERARISEIFRSLSDPDPEEESEPTAADPTPAYEPEDAAHPPRHLELIERPVASFDEQPNESPAEQAEISPFEQQLAALEQTAFPVIEHISTGDWAFDDEGAVGVGAVAEDEEDHDGEDIDLTADLEQTVSAREPVAPVPFAAAVAEFTDAVEALEPVVDAAWDQTPREPVEPIALGAWRSWPDIEGTTAERGEDPFAIVDAIGTGAVDADTVPMLNADPELVPTEMPIEAAAEETDGIVGVNAAASTPEAAPFSAQSSETAAHPALELEAAAGNATNPVASSKGEHPEWVDLIESLRRDIQRLRTERTKGGSAAAAAPKPAVTAKAEAAPAKRRPEKARPLQDEWGFFDPEQCGFAALLDKLDEITDSSEDEKAGTVA